MDGRQYTPPRQQNQNRQFFQSPQPQGFYVVPIPVMSLAQVQMLDLQNRLVFMAHEADRLQKELDKKESDINILNSGNGYLSGFIKQRDEVLVILKKEIDVQYALLDRVTKGQSANELQELSDYEKRSDIFREDFERKRSHINPSCSSVSLASSQSPHYQRQVFFTPPSEQASPVELQNQLTAMHGELTKMQEELKRRDFCIARLRKENKFLDDTVRGQNSGFNVLKKEWAEQDVVLKNLMHSKNPDNQHELPSYEELSAMVEEILRDDDKKQGALSAFSSESFESFQATRLAEQSQAQKKSTSNSPSSYLNAASQGTGQAFTISDKDFPPLSRS